MKILTAVFLLSRIYSYQVRRKNKEVGKLNKKVRGGNDFNFISIYLKMQKIVEKETLMWDKMVKKVISPAGIID